MSTPLPSTRLTGIDALRGLAAISVVFYHYTTRYQQKFGFAEPPGIEFPFGHLGVNLFFVISGFVIFMTLEDETGIANIVVWPKLFEQYRREVLGGRLVTIDGPVQSESGVTHVIAERVHDYTPLLAKLSAHGEKLDPTGPTDEPRRGTHEDPRQSGHPRNVRINLDVKKAASVMPKGRNFH